MVAGWTRTDNQAVNSLFKKGALNVTPESKALRRIPNKERFYTQVIVFCIVQFVKQSPLGGLQLMTP